jgi:hypothetical protein
MSSPDEPMVEPESPADDPESPAEDAAPAPTSRWWVAAITFIAGVIVGVLAVGLLSLGKPDFEQAADTPAAPSASGPQPSAIDTAGLTGQAQVNIACLRVINEAQDVYTILAGIGDVVDDVDLQQLDDIVRRLQPLEPRLQRDLQDCQVHTSVETGPGGASAVPTATPTR